MSCQEIEVGMPIFSIQWMGLAIIWKKKFRGLIFAIITQRCPTYQLPQNAENGDPKIRNRDGPGNSGKFKVSVEFPQEALVRAIPGNSFWGPHFGDLGGFSGGNENGQSWWYVGQFVLTGAAPHWLVVGKRLMRGQNGSCDLGGGGGTYYSRSLRNDNKFLDNKICIFEILLSWRFPQNTAFLEDFPLRPQGPPPQKRKFYFYLSSRRLWYRARPPKPVLEGSESGIFLVCAPSL